MHVASKELCEELYALSGWEPENWYDLDPDGKPEEYFSTSEDRLASPDGEYVPAYDLGYLLRKLPYALQTHYALGISRQADDYWAATYGGTKSGKGVPFKRSRNSPEDAACKLAIELFKQGILTPELSSKEKERL